MKIRGFIVKHRVSSLFRRVYRRKQSAAAGRKRLEQVSRCVSKFLKWGDQLKTKAISMCSKNSGLQKTPVLGKRRSPPPDVPKGKMAVYIGQRDGDCKRVLVPVIYMNHPWFGRLLEEAEKEYGHDHPGGITIPCRFSDFEYVKTRLATVLGSRKILAWKRRR